MARNGQSTTRPKPGITAIAIGLDRLHGRTFDERNPIQPLQPDSRDAPRGSLGVSLQSELTPRSMPRLKDVCLSVRYAGNGRQIAAQLFEAIAPATTVCRLLITDLSRENAVLTATSMEAIIARGIELRILVALPSAASTGENGATNTNTDPMVASLAKSFAFEPTAEVDCQPLVSLRWCEASFDDKAELPRVGGFVSDAGNEIVSFSAEIEPFDARPNPNLIFAASWTWGDPLKRVRKAAAHYDDLWNRATSAPTADASKLPQLLVELARHPEKAVLNATGIKLFKHQEKAIAAWLQRGSRGVFRMCTGSGKTISALASIRELAAQRTQRGETMPPVIVSVPTRILADQWVREIRSFGFKFTLAAYNSYDQWSQVLEPALRNSGAEQPRFVITTYRTIADDRFIAKVRRAGENGLQAVWIADEMHNLASLRLREMMKQLSGAFKFRLGLSATPEIEGDLATTQWLLAYFGEICASYDLEDGIRDGVLCPYRYHPIPAYLSPDVGTAYLRLLQDIQVAHAQAGSSSLMSLYRDAREMLRNSGVQIAAFRDLLKNLTHGEGLSHTLVYCPPGCGTFGNEQSDTIETDPIERRLIADVIDILRENALSPSSILGETPVDERNEILTRFADGRINALCAIGCLDEGVDVPSIKRAIILYSVDREKQFIQRRGRILRQPKGLRGKIADIFDILILPQGSSMPGSQAKALLDRELRRYRKFAELALNREDADRILSAALEHATRPTAE